MERKKIPQRTTAKIRNVEVSKKSRENWPELNIAQASPEQLVAKYCNLTVIHHTKREFLLDFLLSLPDRNILTSRLITNPQHAKRLYEALGQNIEMYEKTFGTIEL